ncbi:MAG TPA: hypothetical protein VNT26_23960, partial [Candidatus Sulfotelmatobacter sp.]|nr:hypothetical protein [Candidatus Sulfotelmatobacter sp.]
MRRVGVGLLAALLVSLAGGCKKSPSTEPSGSKQAQSAQPSAPPVETVARVHWLGKKRLAAETNAAAFMAIWNLPESVRLEAQTLDKLALAPWRSSQPGTNQLSTLNSQLSTLLRPLLDDLLQEESYLEIRNATNQPGELALAIRLNAQRAALWETNLAAVLESLTGTRPTPVQGANGGWQLRITNQLATFRSFGLTRAGDWTILGLAPDKTALAAELLARIQKDQAPCP